MIWLGAETSLLFFTWKCYYGTNLRTPKPVQTFKTFPPYGKGLNNDLQEWTSNESYNSEFVTGVQWGQAGG